MCYKPTNQCSVHPCKRVQKLPMNIQPCKKAMEARKPCPEPVDLPVIREERQPCTQCSGRNDLLPLVRKARAPEARPGHTASASHEQDRPTSNGHRRPTSHVRSVSTHSSSSEKEPRQPSQKGASKAPIPPTSALALRTKQISHDDDNKQLGGRGQAQGRPTIKPLDLSPEPAIWQTWRTSDPATDDETRDSRYQEAMRSAPERRWPLPYEAFEKYHKRQLEVCKRDPGESKRFHHEWIGFRMHELELYPSDRKYFQRFLWSMDRRQKEQKRLEELRNNPPRLPDDYYEGYTTGEEYTTDEEYMTE